jgi:hypothetical protein
MSRSLCVLLILSLLPSCLIVPDNAAPSIDANAVLASQYNFRGIPNNEHGVFQADATIDLPTKLETGLLSFKTFANFDLSDSVGNAWFPGGHGGEPSQINLQASYSETYRGFDITSGVVSYALQNPDDFPFATERGETKELFVVLSREVFWKLVPALGIHYDFDEVDGWYFNGAVGREFPIGEKWAADAGVSLGYSDGDQSEWNYGLNESGFADLQALGRLSYFLDNHTTIRATVNGSTIIDEDLQDWFDLIDIASNNLWATIGVNWGY